MSNLTAMSGFRAALAWIGAPIIMAGGCGFPYPAGPGFPTNPGDGQLSTTVDGTGVLGSVGTGSRLLFGALDGLVGTRATVIMDGHP